MPISCLKKERYFNKITNNLASYEGRLKVLLIVELVIVS